MWMLLNTFAIEYFKKAIKESDEIIAECSDDLKTKLTEKKEHFTIAMAAMEKQIPKKTIYRAAQSVGKRSTSSRLPHGRDGSLRSKDASRSVIND